MEKPEDAGSIPATSTVPLTCFPAGQGHYFAHSPAESAVGRTKGPGRPVPGHDPSRR